MNYILTDHTRKHLADRDVLEWELAYAMDHKIRGRRHPGKSDTVVIYGYAPNGGVLKICVAADDERRIVTFGWTRG